MGYDLNDEIFTIGLSLIILDLMVIDLFSIILCTLFGKNSSFTHHH